MNPLLLAKVLGGLVALALVAGGVHWAGQTIHKAGERDAAVARVAQVEREKVELAATFAAAQAADVAIDAHLADFRADLGKGLANFQQSLTALPLTHEVPRETLPDGTLAPCHERDPARYRSLFNSAVDGTAAP